MEFVDEDGVIHEDSEGTRAANSSKASFKLDLIETVNADPFLEASDLKLIAAYAAVVGWPGRQAWLSTSRARAMTGLSERQVGKSRLRLSGVDPDNKDNPRPLRVYLDRVRVKGQTTIYRLENPWREDCRQHVAIRTEYLRQMQAERQALRRQSQRVPAANADTEDGMSHSPSDCDVPAMNAGNIPADTPQDIALKKAIPFTVSSYGELPEPDAHVPYPVPETEDELASALADFRDHGFSPAVIGYFRIELQAGRLTPAMVEQQRSLAA